MYECLSCTDTFYWESQWENHMDEYDHWPECETCTRTFRTWRACNQHMNDTNHWAPRFECETCTREFMSQNAANQHMNALGHWTPKIPCETCNEVFFSQSAADQHMASLGHYRNYCKPCGQHFMNENNLRMHLNSKIHRGQTVSCPFCKANFTTASGVTHHLERGSCPNAPNVNRKTILKMIRQRDPTGAITIKQLEWKDENVGKFSATDRAYNGYYWECYICHREFDHKFSLNSHLNSSVHMQNAYHCPNARVSCGKQFSTLAALFSHLESERCSFMRFEKVQQQVGNVLNGNRRLTFN